MKPIQVEDVADGGIIRDECMDNWAIMVPLARLKLPSRVNALAIISSSSSGTGGGRGDAEEEEEEEEVSSSSSDSYYSEDNGDGDGDGDGDAEEGDRVCRGLRMCAERGMQISAGEGGTAINTAGGCCPMATDHCYSCSDETSSCETPKGHAFAIPEPLSPPSPPRKKRALANSNLPRGTAALFSPPDNFEVFFSAVASPL